MIRPYTNKDRKRLLQLLRLNTPKYFNHSEEKDFILYLDHHLENYFVLEQNDIVVSAGGFNTFDEGKTMRLAWHIVHPDYHGQGLGTTLTQYRINSIKKIPTVQLIVVRTSQLVYPFYEKMGFELKKVEKDFWAEGFDLYEMHIKLAKELEELTTEKRLYKAIEELQSMRFAQSYLFFLEKKIEEKNAEIDSLLTTIELEEMDVTLLESFSIINIFSNILVDQFRQLEIERQEYLQAVLRYKDACKSVELLKFEQKVLEDKIKKIPALEESIKTLTQQREFEIIKNNEQYKEQLFSLNQEIDKAYKINREVYEAQIIGTQCKQLTKKILALLTEAAELRNWGYENNIAEYSKEKSKVDKAVELFYELKIKLLQFEKELHDIFKQNKINLVSNIGQFDSFVDVYYNYMINDWVIRSRISSILSMISALHDEVTRMGNILQNVEKKLKHKIDSAELTKKELILGL